MQMEQQDRTGVKIGGRQSSSSRYELRAVMGSSPSGGEDDDPASELRYESLRPPLSETENLLSHVCVCVLLLLVSVAAD